MTIPVIFRKWKDGEVIALFPTLPSDSDPWINCLSYLHVGQHGSANLDLINRTLPASQEEYQNLLDELLSIGYNDVKIYKRVQDWMNIARITGEEQ
jgi:hypothetical protein